MFLSGELTKPFGTKLEHYCDYDFFHIIDTESKAYWLGFLYADGCVTDQGVISLLLAGHEKGHLEKYKSALNAEHPIEERHDKMRAKGKVVRTQHNVKIRLHSKTMAADLYRLGVHPRKSFTLKFPTSDQVPSHLLHHFIRGYFDGDGSISHSCTKRYNGKWYFSVISSDAFIRGLKNALLASVDITRWTVYPHPESKGTSYFAVLRVPDINRIRDYLYRDATVYLDRKKAKFEDVPVRYYLSRRDEILATLRGRLKDEGSDVFTSLDVKRLYSVDSNSAFAVVKALKEHGKVTVVHNKGRTLYYKFIT